VLWDALQVDRTDAALLTADQVLERCAPREAKQGLNDVWQARADPLVLSTSISPSPSASPSYGVASGWSRQDGTRAGEATLSEAAACEGKQKATGAAVRKVVRIFIGLSMRSGAVQRVASLAWPTGGARCNRWERAPSPAGSTNGPTDFVPSSCSGSGRRRGVKPAGAALQRRREGGGEQVCFVPVARFTGYRLRLPAADRSRGNVVPLTVRLSKAVGAGKDALLGGFRPPSF
jgi:hypothetical protein